MYSHKHNTFQGFDILCAVLDTVIFDNERLRHYTLTHCVLCPKDTMTMRFSSLTVNTYLGVDTVDCVLYTVIVRFSSI